MDKPTRTGPVEAAERIESLDVLRGFAVLGILVMNIQAFSMPGAAYFNPTVYGDLSGINFFTWLISYLLVDQKFMSLFSLLFGAGVCLFADRAEARSGRSAGLHYRRMFYLLVFGLVHAYFLWSGDILVAYAICGSVIFLFRNRSPRKLVVIGLAVFAAASLISIAIGLTTKFIPEKDVAEITAFWTPDAAKIDAELLAYRGGWLAQQTRRVDDTLAMHTTALPTDLLWQSAGIMLIGMALYRWHILSAAAKRSILSPTRAHRVRRWRAGCRRGRVVEFCSQMELGAFDVPRVAIQLLGKSHYGVGIRGPCDVGGSPRMALWLTDALGCCGSNGIHQLHRANADLHDYFLRAWIWIIRKR